ncbi:hypothetical protein, partial [Amycolatopsis sp. KNN50.9b]|uniref:hypothetical protein n=1 Tax=Amycolatopsis sp. KNN50.9b TaxID=2018303 RepID=UPI0018E9789F
MITDREGRWWQAMECCARCAAATPGAKTAATSQPPSSQVTGRPAPTGSGTSGPQFSDQQAAAGTAVPAPRSVPARRRPPQAKIAQRVIPHDLRPVALRDELIELGDLFRAYQQRSKPDLALLADLQERKARAFTTWADVTCEGALRWEARRAEQAAATARFQHQQRTGRTSSGPGQAGTGSAD